MKKIITLVASALLFTSAFAQYDQKGYDKGKGNDAAYNDRSKKDDNRRSDRYSFSIRERDIQVAQINREYDRKIAAVKHRWFMNRSKKDAMICSLEDQRKREIRMVYAKFNNNHNRFDDNDHKRNW